MRNKIKYIAVLIAAVVVIAAVWGVLFIGQKRKKGTGPEQGTADVNSVSDQETTEAASQTVSEVTVSEEKSSSSESVTMTDTTETDTPEADTTETDVTRTEMTETTVAETTAEDTPLSDAASSDTSAVDMDSSASEGIIEDEGNLIIIVPDGEDSFGE